MIWNQFTTQAAAMKVLANDIDGLGNWPQVRTIMEKASL